MKVFMNIKIAALFCGVLFLAGCGQTAQTSEADTVQPTDELHKQAQLAFSENRLLEARDLYRQFLEQNAGSKSAEQAQQELYSVNLKILFSDISTPNTIIHEVISGDTLGKIAKKYNVNMELIKESNGMKDDVVRLGKKLRIWTAPFSIHIDKSRNELILRSAEDIIKIYPVSTGANNITPVGEFKIVEMLKNPVWYKDGGMAIPPESPENVLGTRWLGFDKKGYGIHGTTEPDKMGQQVTAGCVRMRNEEVEELFKIVPRGTLVTIVD